MTTPGDTREPFRFLAETIPVQVWTSLPDGNLDFVTEQTARSFGLSAKQLLAEGWQNVVHPEDLPLVVERWVHSLKTGDTYEVEFRLKMATGEYACHLARAIPQRDEAGTIVRWFGTNTNIEVQRELQRRTQALLDEVAQQAAESEAALAALRAQNAEAKARIEELQEKLRSLS